MDASTRRHADGGRDAGTGTLFVVATPIGNLEDITLRALRVLREVAVVAAEDTRRTSNLLRYYKVETPLISLHEHNERQRLALLLGRLHAGQSIAAVSDAGTPGVSDPGARLVSAAREAGIRVEPIPGPSAVTAALSASGVTFDRFAFAGFPPARSKDRNLWFRWVSSLPDVPVVCFEAPHRIKRFLTEARALLVNRPIIVARELTKTHEQWLDGAADVPEKGEFVVIFGQTTERNILRPLPRDEEIASLFGQITETKGLLSRRAAVKAVANELGLPVKTVYAALERAKKQPA